MGIFDACTSEQLLIGTDKIWWRDSNTVDYSGLDGHPVILLLGGSLRADVSSFNEKTAARW